MIIVPGLNTVSNAKIRQNSCHIGLILGIFFYKIIPQWPIKYDRLNGFKVQKYIVQRLSVLSPLRAD